MKQYQAPDSGRKRRRGRVVWPPAARIWGLAGVLVGALAITPANAQQQPAQQPAQPQLSQEEPVKAEVKQFKDWALNCAQKQGEPAPSCFMLQNISSKETGQRVLQIVVGHFGPEQRLGALISVPLGIRLPPGISLQIDEEPAILFPLERCNSGSCQAQAALSDALLTSFKAGQKGQVSFVDGTGQTLAVAFSLMGFSAAFKELP